MINELHSNLINFLHRARPRPTADTQIIDVASRNIYDLQYLAQFLVNK